MHKCSGQHLIDTLAQRITWASTAAEAMREAWQLLDLAYPSGWRSPAATAYEQALSELRWRCHLGANTADSAVAELRGWRTMVLSDLGQP
jgi:hypothetical protein